MRYPKNVYCKIYKDLPKTEYIIDEKRVLKEILKKNIIFFKTVTKM